jgi:hypothetical protein
MGGAVGLLFDRIRIPKITQKMPAVPMMDIFSCKKITAEKGISAYVVLPKGTARLRSIFVRMTIQRKKLSAYRMIPAITSGETAFCVTKKNRS